MNSKHEVNLSRAEAVKLLNDLFEEDYLQIPSPHCWHFGRQHLKYFLDQLYGGPPIDFTEQMGRTAKEKREAAADEDAS